MQHQRPFSMDISISDVDELYSGNTIDITVPIREDNQFQLLENIDGNLVLCCDEVPQTFCGCYLLNSGKFPYVIKKELDIFLHSDAHDGCRVKVVGQGVRAGDRFRFSSDGRSVVWDERGDCCVWLLTFRVKLIEDELSGPSFRARTFLLRWNPAVSSFKEEYYRGIAENCPDFFQMDWSVYDWQLARQGDEFYMVRVGDGPTGIFFRGIFTSAPYTDTDSADPSRNRYYVDIDCIDASEDADSPILTAAELQAVLPDIDWTRGHSGVVLTDAQQEKLDALWELRQEDLY